MNQPLGVIMAMMRARYGGGSAGKSFCAYSIDTVNAPLTNITTTQEVVTALTATTSVKLPAGSVIDTVYCYGKSNGCLTVISDDNSFTTYTLNIYDENLVDGTYATATDPDTGEITVTGTLVPSNNTQTWGAFQFPNAHKYGTAATFVTLIVLYN